MKMAYMYGFNKKTPDETGFLNVDGYQKVSDWHDATPFSLKNDGRKGWASPKKWLEFFNDEDELQDWKFHLVYKETDK